MSFIKTSIDQPITVAVGVVLCLLAGFIALERVPVQLAPEIEDTVIAVTTNWENASPQEVEREIVEKQEERLQGIANLRTITSTSSLGQAQIRLEFHQGTDKDAALREVSDKLRQVPDYPDDVDEPVVEASDPQSRDYIAWVTFYSDDPDVDVRTLQDFLELRVKPRLERVEGISEVQIRGGMEREVQIRFDPVQLAQRGISYGQFARAIWSTNRNASAGALADGKTDVRLRMVGRFASIEQVENTVVRQDEGGPIYVKDLAEVVQTYKEPVDFVRANGRTVTAMNFQREIGSNVIEVMNGLQAELRDIEKDGGLLDSYSKAQGHKGRLHLIQVADNTTYIHSSIDLVMGNIWVGGALAIFVLVLFLRSVRAVGIISLAIPISVIGTIVAMVSLGRSINVISLAGMAFAVGMVVDNAIVVLENIYRLQESGKDAYRAALEGTQEVAGAVLASTLTTVVVFVPILLIQELAGQMFRDIALAICVSVTLSLIVSLTVVPCAAALVLRGRKVKFAPPAPGSRGGLAGLNPSRAVGRVTEFLLAGTGRRLVVVAAFTAVSIAGSILLMPPIDYLPTGNRNIVFGMMIFPPGYNLDQVSEIGARVENRMKPFWEAGPGIFGDDGNKVDPKDLPMVPAFRVPGQPPDMIQPPPLQRYFFVGRGGMSFHGGICADPKKAIDLTHLFNWATAGEVVPGTLAFARQFPIFRVGGSSGASVEINVTGPSLEKVTDASSALYGKLVGLYGPWSVQPSPSNFNIPGPEMQVIPNLNAMSDVRVSSDELALAVAANGDGALVGEYQVGGDLIDLKLISKDAVGQKDLDALPDIPIATGTDFTFGFNTFTASGIVTLDSLADIVRTSAPQEIKRVGRQRAVTLEFRPPNGMPLQEAVENLETHIAELRSEGGLPLGVDANLAGSASKLGAMREALLGDGTLRGTVTSSLFLALLVVYLLMCVLFQRFVEPLVIMFTVPLATLGGFLALYGVHYWSLTDPYTPVQNLDVLTILGFVILAGVVVNNAILIVHQTGNFLASGETGPNGEPMTPRRAIAMSVESRVRPILMSSLTSVGGMLPLVVVPGSGSELYRGLGAVVCGGLLVSTLFTLFLVPSLLSLVYDVREAFARRKAASLSPELAPSK